MALLGKSPAQIGLRAEEESIVGALRGGGGTIPQGLIGLAELEFSSTGLKPLK